MKDFVTLFREDLQLHIIILWTAGFLCGSGWVLLLNEYHITLPPFDFSVLMRLRP